MSRTGLISSVSPLALAKYAATTAYLAGILIPLQHYLGCLAGNGCGIGFPNCGVGACHHALFELVRLSVLVTGSYVFFLKFILEPREVELAEYCWPTAHDCAVSFQRWHLLRNATTFTMAVKRDYYLPAAALYGTLTTDAISVASYTPGPDALIPIAIGIATFASLFNVVRLMITGQTIIFDQDNRLIFRNRKLVGRFDDVDHLTVVRSGINTKIQLVLKSSKLVIIDTALARNAWMQCYFASHLAEYIDSRFETAIDVSASNSGD